MTLSTFDYGIIFFFFALVIVIGIIVSKKSGKNSSEFFLSGRNMPWWLLGFSMVATTFSTDTPNFVTDVVRNKGVSGNWIWWAFLLTGLLTVFVYAKLWRKSNVKTDMEFYELRYGGKPARFLRGFRSIYLGFAFNVLAMAGVTLAAIKIGQVMLGLSSLEVVGIAGTITVLFSAIGGFRGVIYTDFILFFVAMAGSIGAAYYLVNLPEVGGLSNLIAHENVQDKIALLPSWSDKEKFITLLIIPLAVQWWSSWFPGGEPGGGGYIAQRMLAAKNENHAVGATFFFNVMHYALRPWPWIIVALVSLVVFPDIASIQAAFPNVEESKLGHDLAYSAMLTMLPSGLLGLVLASLGAAYMSTISTHLNWGSSYIVNDFYTQHIKKDASEKELVRVGRLSTVLLMLISTGLALLLNNALQLFDIIIMFGAGTGMVFILRWFWSRINAWSEITAMFVSGIISILLNFTSLGAYLFGQTLENGQLQEGVFESWWQYPFVVLFTSICWLTVTFLTPREAKRVLYHFYKTTQPGGPGWKSVIEEAKSENVDLEENNEKWSVPNGILAVISATIAIYGCLFTVGKLIYGEYNNALIFLAITIASSIALLYIWKKMKGKAF
ncbi:sodium:solute symporter family protein [Brumimicrobium aurantiacum]|uniref:Na+:solute symporter n=1 Tax=Brumimicrobium aurantiacum TaxID=1737063 RepID=A0A3E1F243_9FLAO|nr:sodium:solute symporter family protein [Brumimicrobium aurantiacum]RFC55860.1 Na+:solute symporter [Brumimicrobium aurantiacum]